MKVAITPLVSSTVLPAVLAAYRRLQPEAELTFDEGLLVQALPGLIEGRIDFAIALASPQDLPYEIEFEALADIEAGPSPATATRSSRRDLGNAERHRLGAEPERRQPKREPGRLARPPRHRPAAPHHPLLLALPDGGAGTAQRPDRLRPEGPAFADPLVGAGLRALAVQPLPPTMLLGLLTLRGVPLGSAAKKLANLFRRELEARPPTPPLSAARCPSALPNSPPGRRSPSDNR